MVKSHRKYDMAAEQKVAKFLDRYLYSSNVNDFKRFLTKEEQWRGKDVQFSWGNLKNIIVDEKAQIYYVNKNIPTFAFEVDFIDSAGQKSKGWLFDSDKEAEYYLMIQITAKKDKFEISDIEGLECMLIKREAIIIFLVNQGIDLVKSEEISDRLRNKHLSGAQLKGKYNGLYFFYTEKLAEQPVNIVIYKDVLKNLCVKHFNVTKVKIEYL